MLQSQHDSGPQWRRTRRMGPWRRPRSSCIGAPACLGGLHPDQFLHDADEDLRVDDSLDQLLDAGGSEYRLKARARSSLEVGQGRQVGAAWASLDDVIGAPAVVNIADPWCPGYRAPSLRETSRAPCNVTHCGATALPPESGSHFRQEECHVRAEESHSDEFPWTWGHGGMVPMLVQSFIQQQQQQQQQRRPLHVPEPRDFIGRSATLPIMQGAVAEYAAYGEHLPPLTPHAKLAPIRVPERPLQPGSAHLPEQQGSSGASRRVRTSLRHEAPAALGARQMPATSQIALNRPATAVPRSRTCEAVPHPPGSIVFQQCRELGEAGAGGAVAAVASPWKPASHILAAPPGEGKRSPSALQLKEAFSQLLGSVSGRQAGSDPSSTLSLAASLELASEILLAASRAMKHETGAEGPTAKEAALGAIQQLQELGEEARGTSRRAGPGPAHVQPFARSSTRTHAETRRCSTSELYQPTKDRRSGSGNNKPWDSINDLLQQARDMATAQRDAVSLASSPTTCSRTSVNELYIPFCEDLALSRAYALPSDQRTGTGVATLNHSRAAGAACASSRGGEQQTEGVHSYEGQQIQELRKRSPLLQSKSVPGEGAMPDAARHVIARMEAAAAAAQGLSSAAAGSVKSRDNAQSQDDVVGAKVGKHRCPSETDESRIVIQELWLHQRSTGPGTSSALFLGRDGSQECALPSITASSRHYRRTQHRGRVSGGNVPRRILAR